MATHVWSWDGLGYSLYVTPDLEISRGPQRICSWYIPSRFPSAFEMSLGDISLVSRKLVDTHVGDVKAHTPFLSAVYRYNTYGYSTNIYEWICVAKYLRSLRYLRYLRNLWDTWDLCVSEKIEDVPLRATQHRLRILPPPNLSLNSQCSL